MKLLLLILLTHFIVLPASEETIFTKVADTEQSSLLGRKWDMQDMRFLYDNTQYYYKRNDYAESNINFDNDYIIFNCGSTGIYHQTDNVEYPLKWHFIKNKKNAIEFTISKFRNNSDLVVNWENIELSFNSIKYTEYYTHKNGLHCLGTGIRTSENPEITSTEIIVFSTSPASTKRN